MKLELKHLAPYLPYGLKIINVSLFQNNFKKYISNLVLIPSNIEIGLKDVDGISNKPILRPLCDFNDIDKIKDFSGFNWCDMYDEFFSVWFDDICNIEKLILQCPYEIMQYFLAKHYDVFDLITQGLAVSIHDVR